MGFKLESMASLKEFKKLYHFYFFFILIASVHSKETAVSTDPSYYYNLCAPSKCGNLLLKYPFTLPTPCHPSPLETTCPNKSLVLSSPTVVDPKRVLSVNFSDPSTTSIIVASEALFACGTQISHQNFLNIAPSFKLQSGYTVGTHYNCTAPMLPDLVQGLQNASCLGCNGEDPDNVCYYAPGYSTSSPDPNCQIYSMITVAEGPQFFNATRVKDLRVFLQSGYELRNDKPGNCRRCEVSGGRCGANPISGTPVCFCTSSVHSDNCTDGVVEDLSTWLDRLGGHKARSSKVIVALISSSISALLLVVVVVVLVVTLTCRQKRNTWFNKAKISEMSTTRYSYSQIKKLTNNFSSKLGEGGFAKVYKGIINQNGIEVPVAVKIMKRSTHSEKQFVNEVATIGSVHHQNLVGMLGYCVERDTHALVYEFVENGALDKYIYNIKKGKVQPEVGTKSDEHELSLKQVFSIALETARGILYLHQGCRVGILHCDIKPANVLVDSKFSAKVADFGLARMIDKDRSHVSLTAAQGTPGYAAPEMWLKSYGPVTEKSDVYSYGMLLLEMVGGRKNYETDVLDSTETYFPEWLYNKVEKNDFVSVMKRGSVGDNSEIVGNEEMNHNEDEAAIWRMCLVGLWSIQNMPSNRPSMDRVVQMLEGHVEIGIPPNPFPHSTTTTIH